VSDSPGTAPSTDAPAAVPPPVLTENSNQRTIRGDSGAWEQSADVTYTRDDARPRSIACVWRIANSDRRSARSGDLRVGREELQLHRLRRGSSLAMHSASCQASETATMLPLGS